jgi:hypothetical protein
MALSIASKMIASAGLRAHQRFLENGIGQTLDLDVHLDGRDALGRPRHLEVHIPAEVLFILQVGENDVLPFSSSDTSPSAMPETGEEIGTRRHERQRGPASRSHGRRSVGFQNFRDDADGVGEVLLLGQHGLQSALREVSVADLAIAHEQAVAGFAHRNGGKL